MQTHSFIEYLGYTVTTAHSRRQWAYTLKRFIDTAGKITVGRALHEMSETSWCADVKRLTGLQTWLNVYPMADDQL